MFVIICERIYCMEKKRAFCFFPGPVKRTVLLLALIMALSGLRPAPVSAGTYLTTRAQMPDNTDVRSLTLTMKNRRGPLTFTIRAQVGFDIKKKSYLAQHGCAVSALTTVLGAYNKKYAGYSRVDVYKKLERKIFGKQSWKSNYSRSLGAQRPVSMYGISRILRKCKVKNTYVRRFSNASAVRRIENHLRKGNVVIIEANNHTQDNGSFHSSYNDRWAKSKHTMVLLGMTDTGKVIIADSATRSWAGKNQRIKYASMDRLVRYMIPCTSSSKYNYYHTTGDSGGYILVN